ncbi:unnamed protein product, partial [Cyprideis torosa]
MLTVKCQRLICKQGKRLCAEFGRPAYVHTSSTMSIESIKSGLSNFQGGSVDLRKDDSTGISWIRLNQPSKKNALTGKMMVDFHDAVVELENWHQGKGLILYGEGDFFCSGGDLNFVRQTLTPEDGYRMSSLMHDTLLRLHLLPLVSVALVQGRALGGGAEIVTACDFRMVTPDTKIGFVQGKMGVATGWGGGTFLVHILGHEKALDVLTTGRSLSATEAVDIGLVQKVVSTTDPLADTETWLKERTGYSSYVNQTIKKIVVSKQAETLRAALEVERKLFASLWGGEAQQVALQQRIKHR